MYFSEYFDSESEMESAISKSKIYTTNSDCMWIEGDSKGLEAWEVCPDRFTLNTRSRGIRDYRAEIDLEYSFTETAPMKAAVFSKAFVEAGFKVKKP